MYYYILLSRFNMQLFGCLFSYPISKGTRWSWKLSTGILHIYQECHSVRDTSGLGKKRKSNCGACEFRQSCRDSPRARHFLGRGRMEARSSAQMRSGHHLQLRDELISTALAPSLLTVAKNYFQTQLEIEK